MYSRTKGYFRLWHDEIEICTKVHVYVWGLAQGVMDSNTCNLVKTMIKFYVSRIFFQLNKHYYIDIDKLLKDLKNPSNSQIYKISVNKKELQNYKKRIQHVTNYNVLR